jgi:hypothetical protein
MTRRMRDASIPEAVGTLKPTEGERPIFTGCRGILWSYSVSVIT